MPRSIWSGAISFGLVSVPVKLFSAISQRDVSFHQIDKTSGARIRYKRVSEKTGREIPYERIAKGYEVDKDEYVVIDPKELEKFTPDATRRIDIEDFVDLTEIDPIYFEHPYFLAPDKGGDKAYMLLRKAMEKSGKIGIGKVVIRNKEYLAAIRPYGDKALALETMLFPDEVNDVEEVPGLPDRRAKVTDKELRMANQLIDSLSGEFDPEKYHDEYREHVMDFIKKKSKGGTVTIEEEEPERPAVIDLMDALRASVEESGKGGRRKRASSSGRRGASSGRRNASRNGRRKTGTRQSA
jgi:DNA end-binding protein Ku